MEVLKYYNAPTLGHSAEFNTKIKVFPNDSKKVKYHIYSNFKGLYHGTSEKKTTTSPKKKYENLYNSKSRLIDLVYCNSLVSPWEYFVTLTFDPGIVDSYNYEEVIKTMHKWLDNMKHQNKNLKYILVPELHKSGRVHIHGLFKDCPFLKLEPARNKSGKLIYRNGTQIYNITNYRYGFTTISKIKNQEAVSVYMSKYMTKELLNISSRKTYWCSQGLERPKIEYAYFNEDTLNFYIANNNIKDYYHNEKTVSFSII